jgi:lipopolysaccharide biosynthesis regulator YciM
VTNDSARQRLAEVEARIAQQTQAGTMRAADWCVYAFALSSAGEWERAEAVARSIRDDDDERGQALGVLAQDLAKAGLLERAEAIAYAIDNTREHSGALHEKVLALIEIASHWTRRHDAGRAWQLLVAAETAAQALPDPPDWVKPDCLAQIALLCAQIDELEAAAQVWNHAISLSRGCHDFGLQLSLQRIAEQLAKLDKGTQATPFVNVYR